MMSHIVVVVFSDSTKFLNALIRNPLTRASFDIFPGGNAGWLGGQTDTVIIELTQPVELNKNRNNRGQTLYIWLDVQTKFQLPAPEDTFPVDGRVRRIQ